MLKKKEQELQDAADAQGRHADALRLQAEAHEQARERARP